jgi:hypothetical protein
MIAVLMRGAIRGGRHRHSNGTRGGSDGKLHAKDGPEIEQTPRSQPRSRSQSQSQPQSQDGKLHSRTDQRSSKSQPGVQVKKATISEGLERRELE